MIVGTSIISEKGQVTIPKEIRERLKIKPDELVDIKIRRPNWWEMLDWNEMKNTWELLSEDIKNEIREAGMAPV